MAEGEDKVVGVTMSLDTRQFALDLDRFLTRVAPFGFSGAILAADGGEVLLREGYGLADRANDTPNTAGTVFCLGSVTKQFTAAAVMKLAQDGKLDPDDFMSRYLAGVPQDKAGITLHHLLTHTAGTLNYTGPDYEPAGREQVLQKAFASPLLFEPGTEYRYSNAGYSVLAAIVEIVAGQPFERFLYEKLLQPAGMEHTGYTRPDWSGKTIARWYTGDTDHGHALEKPYPSWNVLGNGELLSTLDDMLRSHMALLSDDLLDAETRRRMYTPFLQDYAYGWNVEDTPLGRLIAHNGASELGTSALFRRYVDAGLTIVLFCNQSFGAIPMVRPIQNAISQLLEGEEIELPPAVNPISRQELAPYEGEIEIAGGGRVTARMAGSVLMLEASDQRSINLLAFPELEPDAHEALNETHAQVFAPALDGDFELLASFLANAERRLEPVKRLLQANLAEAEKEYGSRTGVEVLGTVPSTFVSGALDTVVRVHLERGQMGIVSITQDGANVGVAVVEAGQAWALPCVPFAGKLIGYHLPLQRTIEIEPALLTQRTRASDGEGAGAGQEERDVERTVFAEIMVPAPAGEVWRAWTTEEGARSFFAPQCHIELRPGGAYEMFFAPDAEPGLRGGEGMIVMAVEPERMLSFTWNAPPSLPTVRDQMTHVVVRLFETEAGETRVTLRHDGWGEGGEWDGAYEYFDRAWSGVVLPRLKYRFEHGPIDWSNRPEIGRG